MRELFDYHRSWVLLLTSVIFILIATMPLDSFLENFYVRHTKELSHKRNRLAHQLEQWEKDNKRAVEISRSISKEEIQNLLAPANREAFIAALESAASKVNFGAFHYILSPAKKWDGGNKFPGIEKMSISTVLIEANAPHDIAIYQFINEVNNIDGKLILKDLTIEPLNNDGFKNLNAYNLHLQAKYEWLSNEAPQ